MHETRLPLIAIDGPGAVGKSTTAKAVAQMLGWAWLDTGAMYRATALALQRANATLADCSALETVLASLDIRQVDGREFLGEEDVTPLLRTRELARQVSTVAADPRVREFLVDWQRRIAGAGGWVVDGRDIGTTVFPDACCKIFLTADLQARTRRRFLDLQSRGVPESMEAVAAELRRRDVGLATRTVAPLCKAENAVELDSSGWSLDQVVGWIVDYHRCHERGAGQPNCPILGINAPSLPLAAPRVEHSQDSPTTPDLDREGPKG